MIVQDLIEGGVILPAMQEGSSKPYKNNNLDQQYCDLLNDILQNGYSKGDRTGTGTTSVFGRVIRHRMKDGFPLLTSKKMYTKGIIVELLWFLGVHMNDPNYTLLGRTNIKYLVDNGCNIWVGDAYKAYCNRAAKNNKDVFNIETFTGLIKSNLTGFAEEYGNLGPIYGKQWRSFGPDKKIAATEDVYCEPQDIKTVDDFSRLEVEEVCEIQVPSKTVFQNIGGYDQIKALIEDLRNNPDSRRLMVTAWNPLDLESMVLPPCHYGFQCYTRELYLEERMALVTSELSEDGSFQEEWAFTDDKSIVLNHYKVPSRELSLSWNQRSVDTPLGLPFNVASYGFLLEMLAKVVNMVPGELIGYLGDTHIYNNQVDGVKQQITQSTYKLPTLKLNTRYNIDNFRLEDFVIENYQSSPNVKYPLSN